MTVAQEGTQLLQGLFLTFDSEFHEALEKITKAGVAKLKKTSPRSSGKPSMEKHYASQWAMRKEITRFSFEGLIYNKDPTYRLTHLLEYGHAKRGGGRTAAIPHIAPVEEELIKQAVNAAKKAVEKAFR